MAALAVAPDGTWLASAGDDGTVRIWDPHTGQARHTLTGHTDAVTAVAVAPDGTWLASAGGDGTVRIWDPPTGQARHTLTGHTGGVTALAVAPDGTWLASAGDDGTVRIWDPHTGQARHTLTGHTGGVTALAVAPDGTWLASAGDDGDGADLGPAHRAGPPHPHRPHRRGAGVGGRPGRHLAGHRRQTTGRCGSGTRTPGRPATPSPATPARVSALAVAPDGTWLATARRRRDGADLGPATGQTRHTLTGHTGGVSALAVAPDGTWLASAGDDDDGADLGHRLGIRRHVDPHRPRPPTRRDRRTTSRRCRRSRSVLPRCIRPLTESEICARRYGMETGRHRWCP